LTPPKTTGGTRGYQDLTTPWP